MKLSEHGTNFSQKTTLDEINGLLITESPAHNDRVAVTFIYDTSSGVMLEVCDATQTAMFHRAFLALKFEQQKTDFESWKDDLDGEDRFDGGDRLDLKPTPENSFELININGPDVDIECVPEKYKKFIPNGYRTFLTHQVHPIPGNVYNKGNESEFTVFDHVSQRQYNFDDVVENVLADVFNDILPPCAYKQSSRAKRSVCQDEYGNIIPRCSQRPDQVTCNQGCDSTMTGWDCKSIAKGCQYVLICEGKVSQACLKHIGSAQNTCEPCCRMRDCGGGIKECAYLPEDDICPDANVGCPLEKTLTKYTKERKRGQCKIDDNCDSVFDTSSEVANSGVTCWSTTRKVRQKTFCCDERGHTANIPICDDGVR